MSERCAECRGSGFVLHAAEDGVRRARPCACAPGQSLARRVQRARIPRRYEHCTLDDFYPRDASQTEALERARAWAAAWPRVDHGLLFLGPPGTGKTHLVVALARELVGRGAAVLFYEQRELLKTLQGTFDAGSLLRESEILTPLLETELLLLDDLGAGRITPWARDVVHEIVAQRYNDERLMLLTSNHALGDEAEDPAGARPKGLDAPLTLRDRLGEALISRLYEMCRIVSLHGQGAKGDYRREILNARIER